MADVEKRSRRRRGAGGEAGGANNTQHESKGENMSDETHVIHRTVVARSTPGEFVVVSTVDLNFGIERAQTVALFDSLLGMSGGRFESMVFACDAEGGVSNWIDLDCARTGHRPSVEKQHADMVAKWSVQ